LVPAVLKALGLVCKQHAHDLVFYILLQFNFCRILGVSFYGELSSLIIYAFCRT
jgi:hypothetical protein